MGAYSKIDIGRGGDLIEGDAYFKIGRKGNEKVLILNK